MTEPIAQRARHDRGDAAEHLDDRAAGALETLAEELKKSMPGE